MQLTAVRKAELGLIYLLYTQALLIRHEKLTLRNICTLGKELIAENSHITQQFQEQALFVFAKDIYRIFHHIASCAEPQSHEVKRLKLRKGMREKIAYSILVCLIRREFWWLGNFDELRIEHFSSTHKMSQDEAKKFFKKLVDDVSLLGHVSNNELTRHHK